MSVQAEERPPYVVFELRPVEDRNASISSGHYVAKDVAFAIITRPGSRDSLVKEAEQWLKDLAESARQGKVPETWSTAFRAKFDAWKKGEEVPVSGTPIKGWPVLSPGAQAMVIKAGFFTVEDLASAPDSEVSTIGTGAISFKQKALNWIAAASDTGKVVERLSSLEGKLTELAATNAALQAENIRLKLLIPPEKK